MGTHGSEAYLDWDPMLLMSGGLSKLAGALNMCEVSDLRCDCISLLSYEILG